MRKKQKIHISITSIVDKCFAVLCLIIAFAQTIHCIICISCSDSMAVIKKSIFVETEKKRQHIATLLDLQSLFHNDESIIRPSLQHDVDVMHSL